MYSLLLGAIALAGLGVYVYGALLLGGQAYYWLRSGEWVPLPTIALVLADPVSTDTPNGPTADRSSDGVSASTGASRASESSWAIFRRYIPLIEAPAAETWLRNPTSWFGLHRAITGTLGFLSLPAMAIIIGLLLVGAAMGVWLELGSVATTVGGMTSLRLLSTRWPGKRPM